MREKICPLFEKYGSHLSILEKKYSSKGINFIYVYTGQFNQEKYSKDDIKSNTLKSPYIIDSKHTIVNALSANSTGEVFILTPERQIIYRGPLDN